MKTLIIGVGEVGKAHLNILRSRYHDIFYKDKDKTIFDYSDNPVNTEEMGQIDLMMVATQCDAKDNSGFVQMVCDYADIFKPSYINILTTVPPSTCEAISARLPDMCVSHSTTRGLHPHLERGLVTIPKHIGGDGSEVIKQYYEEAGFKCNTHNLARTTEVAHILNNIAYGINIKLADELNALCRHFGVDYMESVIAYTQSNNEGYSALDHNSKCRMLLMPPFGSIGGHCIIYSSNCVPDSYLAKCPMIKGLSQMAQGQKNY